MVRRGEIYWYQPSQVTGSVQQGRRPVLVIQNDAGNRTSTTTIVASITSQQRSVRYPFQVPFSPEESGLRLGGLVLCEQMQTVDQGLLEGLAGALSSSRMREVDLALHRSLGLAF